jgi:hypothetical protein
MRSSQLYSFSGREPIQDGNWGREHSGTDVDIELGPRRRISHPRLFSRQSAHGSICKSSANGSSHNTQPLDMIRHFGERCKKESYIRQRTGGYEPGCPLRLGKKGVAHGQNWISVRYWGSTGFGEEIGAVQTGGSFAVESIQNMPLDGMRDHSPWISGAWTAGLENGFFDPGYTGISGLPMASSTLPALAVVLTSDALPWIVVMPRRFRDGWCAAMRIAKASYKRSVYNQLDQTMSRSLWLTSCPKRRSAV